MKYLLRITGGAAGVEIQVDRDYLIIGRDPSSCHVLLDDDVVSRRHAALELDGQGNLTIVDLASTNGTFVNGAPVNRRVLQDGDTISLGPVGQVDLRYKDSPAVPARDPVRLHLTGEHALVPSAGAQTFAVPAETVPLRNFEVSPPPFTSALNEPGRIQEGRPAKAVCVTCSSTLDAGGTFCSSCGAPAAPAADVVCPQCGKQVGADAKFCKYCAHRLTGPASGAASPSIVSVSGDPFGTRPATSQLKPPAPSFGTVPSADADAPYPVYTSTPSNSHGWAPAAPPGGLTGAPAPPLTSHAPTAPTPDATSGTSSGGAWLTPSGAGIAAICFFLPWVQFSCGGYSRSVSGADIARGDGSLWIVFGAAVVILGAYFVFRSQRRTARSKPLVIVSSLAGAGLLIIKGFQFAQPQETMLGRISPQDLGLSIQPGALGTFAGFIMALVGAAVTRDSPSVASAPRRPMREEVVCALCYAPVPASVVLWFVGMPLLAIPVSYLLWVLVPFGFLLVARHRASCAVRIHAFQSALLSAGFFLVAFLRVMSVRGLNLEEYQPNYTVRSGFWQLLFLVLVGAMAVLLHGAYSGKRFRVPGLTDLATKLAGKVGGGPGASGL